MNIVSVGWNCIYDSGYNYKSDRKNIFLFVLSRSRIRIGGEVMPKNTIIIYDGTVSVDYSTADDFLVCDWICFEADNDTDFLDAELDFNTPTANSDSDFISQIIRNITAEFYSMNGRRIKMLDFMMKTLLMKVAESCTHRENIQTSAEPHFSSLIELREKIYRNPQMKWNVDTMSAYVNMSRSYFQHVYREIFGVSCMTDVISGKIEKAKEILSETGCTVSQVSAMCGYENEEHFMRQFKKIVGVTPTGYRKKS
ncbi:MAG: AraC family transcriptional regulator [Ruminococcus flavefaciens]|nr:AraC family transcriptional regulator [Ruminococcus flavefaciens]MCM1229082.1 AraC family transcriptional regulator [Ruminococcus flavefaciens]